MSGKRDPDRDRDREPIAADVDEDRVFKALASATRRRILDALKERPRTTGELCETFVGLDRCTVMQHLAVLERAGLVVAHRRGRERWNHLSPLPIKHIHDRWIGEYASTAVSLLDRLRADLEAGGADASRPTITAAGQR